MYTAWLVTVSLLYAPHYACSSSDVSVNHSDLLDVSNLLRKALPFTISDKQFQCFRDTKVLHGRSCFTLFGTESCQKGEYLVIDKQQWLKENSLHAVCRPRTCPSDYKFVPDYNKCFHFEDIERVFCKLLDGLTYVEDVFGDMHCICRNTRGRVLNSDDQKCYEFNKRGPCSVGQSFVPFNDFVKIGYGTCKQHPCWDFANNSTFGSVSVNLENDESRCYTLHKQEPCFENLALLLWNFLPGLFFPQCQYQYRILQTVVVHAVSDICVPNNNGTCVKVSYQPKEPFSSLLD